MAVIADCRALEQEREHEQTQQEPFDQRIHLITQHKSTKMGYFVLHLVTHSLTRRYLPSFSSSSSLAYEALPFYALQNVNLSRFQSHEEQLEPQLEPRSINASCSLLSGFIMVNVFLFKCIFVHYCGVSSST